MRPVKQDILANDPHGRVGNCLQACIASLCEKELHEVPHFAAMSDDEWFPNMCNWIYSHGYEFNDLDSPNDSPYYVLAFGPTVRETYHAVIYKGGQLAHDPHPLGGGLLEVKWCASITKT